MMSSLVSQGLLLFIDTFQVPGSDIDIEVEFEVPISSWRCLRCTEVYDVLLESWLEKLHGRRSILDNCMTRDSKRGTAGMI